MQKYRPKHFGDNIIQNHNKRRPAMFKRKILKKLEAWKKSNLRKPLILRGARQVGKTTIVNEFGLQYDNYLYFNMEKSENVKLFEMEIPLDDLVTTLFASV